MLLFLFIRAEKFFIRCVIVLFLTEILLHISRLGILEIHLCLVDVVAFRHLKRWKRIVKGSLSIYMYTYIGMIRTVTEIILVVVISSFAFPFLVVVSSERQFRSNWIKRIPEEHSTSTYACKACHGILIVLYFYFLLLLL
jgi:hypothetical protein